MTPKRLWKIFYRYWMKFAHAFGALNTRLLLTVVYLVAIGPGALFLRLVGKDLLDKSMRRTQSSWHQKPDSESAVENSRYPF